MNPKALDLLKLLLNEKEWLTSKRLTTHFRISTRTLRSVVASCNKDKTLIISSKNGYKINDVYITDIKAILKTNEVKNDTPDKRVDIIVQRLIMSNIALDEFDLSEELYVSPEQINKDLLKVKLFLKEYDLSLEKQKGKYYVLGSEPSKRHAMTSLFIEDINKGELASEVLKNISSIEEINDISDILRMHLREFELYVNDYVFMSLVVHIIIMISRRPIKNTGEHNVKDVIDTNANEYKVSRLVFEDIKNKYKIEINNEDVEELTILLTAQTQPSVPSNIQDVRKYIGDKVYELTDEIISNVLEQYHVDLSSKTFFTKFAIHIKNLLYRAQVNRKTDNPYIETIKQSAPLVFEISVYVANIISRKSGLQISDDEIAYLALHISNAMNDKNEDKKIKAVLVCPSYYDLATNIMMKIGTHFDHNLEVTSIIHFEDELDSSNNYDIILSTVTLKKISEYVKISPVLGNNDYKSIELALGRKKNEDSRKELSLLFKELFSEDRFAILDEKYDRDKCLNLLCDFMIKDNIVSNDYLLKVMERENMLSTCYGKIAIPHSLKPCATKNGIAVAISKEPIRWNDKNVNIVLLLAVSMKEGVAFGDIYNKLVASLYDEMIVEELIDCANFNDFIRILANKNNN